MSVNNSMSEPDILVNDSIKSIVKDINKSKTSIIHTNFDTNLKDLNEYEKAQLERFVNDTRLKMTLTYFVIAFTSIWSISILVFLYLLACKITFVSDAVIITLLTETLVTIIGLPLVVTSHFFPKQ